MFISFTSKDKTKSVEMTGGVALLLIGLAGMLWVAAWQLAGFLMDWRFFS